VQLLFKIAATETSEKANPDKVVTINAELHRALYYAAHNSYLLQSLNSVVDALIVDLVAAPNERRMLGSAGALLAADEDVPASPISDGTDASGNSCVCTPLTGVKRHGQRAEEPR
jgi:hypothetical protein